MKNLSGTPLIIIILLICLAGIVVIAGAIVAIVSPDTLSFHDYVFDVTILFGALGIGVGVGGGAAAVVQVANGKDK